jgi:hypothetical protein
VEIVIINLHTVHFGLGAGYVKAAKAKAVNLIKPCATTTITANPRDRGSGF